LPVGKKGPLAQGQKYKALGSLLFHITLLHLTQWMKDMGNL